MSNTIEKTSYTLPLGPVHPAIHEPIRLDLSIDGEEVVDVDVNAASSRASSVWHEPQNPVQPSTSQSANSVNVRSCHPWGRLSGRGNGCGNRSAGASRVIRPIIGDIERISIPHLLWAGRRRTYIGFRTLFYNTWGSARNSSTCRIPDRQQKPQCDYLDRRSPPRHH
jgi:membrane-bound hydrogenase subunit alpha